MNVARSPGIADSMQVFLVMNLMVSLASYGLFGSEWYLMAGACSVLTRLAAERSRFTEPAAATAGKPVPLQPRVRVTRPGLEPRRVLSRTGFRPRPNGLA